MKVLAIHASHDGCVTYVKNNKIVFHTQLDRYNRFKYSSIAFRPDQYRFSNLYNNNVTPASTPKTLVKTMTWFKTNLTLISLVETYLRNSLLRYLNLFKSS